jgi:aspartyl-tRNA(Asn)/glutamyl-tRNA(Gln) amidotransferase subunit A
MTDCPAALPAAEIAAAYRAGALSPVEVARDALDRAERQQPRLNAFTRIERAAALEAARLSEARWREGAPLSPADGLPATVKANIAAMGWAARRGSHALPDTPSPFDAPATARLREAGTVIIGQTTMPEFGWIGVCHSALNGVTRNPWNPERTPGGSSGGAAVAASLGLGPLHLGTDGAGSIRIPASFTGLFGLKATFGRVPAFPASPFGSLAHVGPLARTVADLALCYRLIAAPDARDMWAWNNAAPDIDGILGRGIRGLRIGWSARLGHVRDLDPEVERLCEAAARRLVELGATVEAADPGFGEADAREPLDTLWNAGCAAILAGVPEKLRSAVDPGFLRAAEAGARVGGAEVLQANVRRAHLHARLLAFHERFDILLTPMMPSTAIETGLEVPRHFPHGASWLDWSPYSYPFNVTAQPAASAPVGLHPDGLPVGLQIVAASGREDLVLRTARAVELTTPFAQPHR